MARLIVMICAVSLMQACGTANPSAPSSGTPSSSQPPPNVQLPGAPNTAGAVALAIGQTTRGSVETNDLACYPNWDSSGKCKGFAVVPPRDGSLDVRLKWNPSFGADLMDLFVVAPSFKYEVSYDGRTEEAVRLRVTRGLTYTILVMSYAPGPQEFELTTALIE